MNAAIIGALGVVLGAALAGLFTLGIESYKRRRAAAAAAGVIGVELDTVISILDKEIEKNARAGIDLPHHEFDNQFAIAATTLMKTRELLS
jgi:ABC-type lipoprotein release transport system permease subunit